MTSNNGASNVVNNGGEIGKELPASIWDRLLLGDTRSPLLHLSTASRQSVASSNVDKLNNQQYQTYNNFALVKSMLLYESVRVAALRVEGRAQHEYPNSNQGWYATLFMIRGRALDRVVVPWGIVSLHAIIYTVIQETVYGGSINGDNMSLLQSWEVFFSFVLNSTLAFLLVFRLQRASDRYWTARYYWGDIVAKARTLVSGLVVHGQGENKDHAIRWLVAYSVAIMELLRGRRLYDGSIFAGVLVRSELDKLETSLHPPLYAMTKIRYHLRKAFGNTPDTPMAMAVERTQTLHRLELQLNIIQDCCGGMERIKATPLPIVYVSHLRTFLIVALLLFPYVYGPSWRWTTIPLVVLAGFAWLGIDCAAEECESPFDAKSVNALDMDAYCIGLMQTTLQEIRDSADEELERQAGPTK
ncbi:hypothetical protein MPSEU_000352300 [Mayamaea pseudoterrestris]|nr:hypothetical protein MPSEU_000352300 [Mayamaea pseudoterrestris]